MRINHWTAVFGLGLVLLGGVSVARAVEKATAQEAEQAAADWLDNLDDGELVIEERLEEGGFEVKGVAGSNKHMHGVNGFCADGHCAHSLNPAEAVNFVRTP